MHHAGQLVDGTEIIPDRQQRNKADDSYFVENPMSYVGRVPSTFLTAEEAKTAVPNDSGAYKYLKDDGTVGEFRDALDTEYHSNIINDNATDFAYDGGVNDPINSTLFTNFVASISTTPINSRPVDFYDTNDYIPQAYLDANGITGNTTIHNEVQPSGYTLLEEYMNQVDEVKQLAFPTAVGSASRQVTGGRGGQVIHVTNLNDTGSGSLREALEATGIRTIVFDVSGVINVQSDINVGDGNFTVAGQTAPEGGITIIGTNSINCTNKENWIFRYIRFRSGYDAVNIDGGWPNTTTVSTRNANYFIFDHCSTAFSKETAGLGGGLNDFGFNTVLVSQNNLIAENDRGTIVGDSNDSDPSTVTVYRNTYINSGWRFPKGGGTIDLDVINTYVYNWEYRTIRMDAHDYKLNIINNHYEAGNGTRLTDNDEILFTTHTNATMSPQIWDEGTLITPYVYNGGSSTYDPTPSGYPQDLSKGWDPFYNSTEPINSSWFASSRLPLNSDTPDILPSIEVKSHNLSNSGANKYIDDNGSVQTYRDVIDSTAIEIANGNASSYTIDGVTYDYSGSYKIPESSYEAMALGLVNETPSNARPGGFYGTNQHIPTVWLTANGYADTTTIHNQVESDGYTVLEHYINQVDSSDIPTPPDPPVSVVGGSTGSLILKGII
jgi:hypothetical protein